MIKATLRVLLATIGFSVVSRLAGANSLGMPFDAQQCDRAIHFAQERLQRTPSDTRGRKILAEGFLCRGLRGDPWSLTRAIKLLSDVEQSVDADVFVTIELFDALRTKWPMSDETREALQRSQSALRASTLECVDDLRSEVDRNEIALAQMHVRVADLLRRTEFDATDLSVEAITKYAAILQQFGPLGIRHAEELLDQCLSTSAGNPLLRFARTELTIGEKDPCETRKTYREVYRSICNVNNSEPQLCEVIAIRIKQTNESWFSCGDEMSAEPKTEAERMGAL